MVDGRSHIGEKIGVYELIDILPERDKYGHLVYVGKCSECGHLKYSHYGAFKGVGNRCNSCHHVNKNGEVRDRLHRWKSRRLSTIYRGMIQRCYNENDSAYRWYGAKGVRVCDEWVSDCESFEDWSFANGYSDGLTIDRIDSSKNYSPDNCRWISMEENARFKGTTTTYNINGKEYSGKQAARLLGFGINKINRYRRKYGYDKTVEFIQHQLNSQYYVGGA